MDRGWMAVFIGLKNWVCWIVGMFAPLRRTLVYFMDFFTGRRDPFIVPLKEETSPDTLTDYVRDPKIVSSAEVSSSTSSLETVEIDMSGSQTRYNLRERKAINYSEDSE
jgi:hypothetical protein